MNQTWNEQVYGEMIEEYSEYIEWLREQKNKAYGDFVEFGRRLEKETNKREICKRTLIKLQDEQSGVTDDSILQLIQV